MIKPYNNCHIFGSSYVLFEKHRTVIEMERTLQFIVVFNLYHYTKHPMTRKSVSNDSGSKVCSLSFSYLGSLNE